MLVKLDHFPKDRGENKTYLKPPPQLFFFANQERFESGNKNYFFFTPRQELPHQKHTDKHLKNVEVCWGVAMTSI